MTISDSTPERAASQISSGSPQSKFLIQIRLASVIICIIVVCLGSSVILGWLFDITLLKSIIAHRVTMKPSTALGLILGGVCLLLWHQQQKSKSLIVLVSLYILSVSAIAFSLITLIEYSFNLDLGTSLLSFPDSQDAVDGVVRGRISPNTAINCLLFNTAILLLIQKYYRTSQILIILVTAIALSGLLGHIYDIDLFYSGGSATGMAIHTAVGFILLSLAFLGTRADKGWMRVITRDNAGGLMARWLLPLVLVLPPSLGGLSWLLFKGNIYYLELIIALRIITEMVLLGVIVWWTAKKLNEVDRQRQRFSQELLDTERRYRAIFDGTFQFIGLLTPDGILLEANQSALEFGGLSKSEVVDRPFWEAYWWQISPQTQLKLQEAIAKARMGEFVRYPVEVQGANQRVVTIDFSLRPIKNEAGQVILIIPEGRDISDRIKVEKALEQSESRYRAIVEDQTELICRYRSDSTMSFVNDAYCRYFSLDKDKLIDRKFTPLIYDEDRERFARLISSMNPTNPTVTITHRTWVKGKVRWNEWNNRIIFDEAGKISEYQAVGRDITTLKEIEAKLRESEERFRRAFEDAATGEALVARNGRFIKVNRSLCEIVGYSEAELLSKTFQEITHPDDLALDLNYFSQMLAGKIRTYQMEKRYFHSSGRIVWILLSVSLVRDLKGQILYFIAQIQDITQRKHTEAQLKALVKELERSNQELDEFASVVSHDLLSPLRKQQMFVDLLQEEYREILDEEGKEYLTRMVGLNLRMERLIRGLLTYARVTTQAKPFISVNLNEVVRDVLYDLESEIERTKAQIEVGELPTVKGDRLQLRQLWQNLLQNSLKFHNRERTPEIKIDRLPSIQERASTKFVCLVVADNGIGFEPEQQEKIFTPFHRLHNYSKYEGTGLGLAICDKIVQRHHGTITAQSQLGSGTTFTICLPIDN